MPVPRTDPAARPVRVRQQHCLAAALALLAWPAASLAANHTFSSNSLIIPMQQEYQTDDGLIAAYGFIYTVLYKSAPLPSGCTKPVTFYWAIAPNKLSQYRCDTNTNVVNNWYATYNDNDGCDFAVQSADGVPVRLLQPDNTELATRFTVFRTHYTASNGPDRGGGTSYMADPTANPKRTVAKYSGGAFVVDSSDRQCFLSMLSSIPELAQYRSATTNARYVNIHSAKASFDAQYARILNQRPPTIAVTGLHDDKIENVLQNAGLDAIANWNTGAVYEYHSEAELLDSTAADAHGLLNNGTKNFGLFWGADGMTATAAELANLDFFLDRGLGAYVEADSIDDVEMNSQRLMTTTGVTDRTGNVAYTDDCNDRLLPTTATFYSARGTGNNPADCFTYGAFAQPWTQTGNTPFQGGQGNYKAFKPGTGSAFLSQVQFALQDGGAGSPPTWTIAAARYKDADLTKGLAIYLAGYRFDNSRIWGERMILNSVLANVPLVLGVELARSEPVGFHDASVTPATDRVYQGTFFLLPDPSETDFFDYSVTAPQRWRFPYTTGHLYQYNLGGIPSGSTSFACGAGASGSCPATNWDAAARLPLPHDRKIFTVLDGSANLGWRKIAFDYTQTRSGCLDADQNGKCDLSEALAQCNTAGVITGTLQRYDAADPTQRNQLGMFVSQVRGFCAGHDSTGAPVMEPSDGQCDDLARQTNRAKLGGIDHGSPAIVGPSRYVTDAAWRNRPVVAYAGARDGMLHAFYVSGGSGWTDPDGTGLPSGVQPGQELWAFVPPGQFCGHGKLAFNTAMVDASVNVIDVFGDFPTDTTAHASIDLGVIDLTSPAARPTGIRKWRTVLLAAAGQGGSELFAMDVTNPLKPVLLWHLGGETEKDGRFDADGNGTFDSGESFSTTNAKSYAFKWFDWDDGVATTDYIPTPYERVDVPANETLRDELKLGKYDYRNLGETYGTAIGKIASGNAFQYVAYVATNMKDYTQEDPDGFRGVEVFAMDLITGQKLWQWEHAYTRTMSSGTVIADNTIPGRVALADVDSDGSVDRIYVGDLEGRVWELSAATGRNLNYLQDTATPTPAWHSFPLYGTLNMTASGADSATKALYTLSGTTLAEQPLTSPIGLGRFTQVRTSLQSYLLGRLAIVQGSMGVDWSIAPFERGSVFVIPISPDAGTRLNAPVDLVAHPEATTSGLLLSAAAWRIQLQAGERVFGMPRIVNNEVIFNTAFGSFSGDNYIDTVTESGNLYQEGSTAQGAAQESIAANQSKSFGGVLVFGNKLVVTTDTSIRASALPSALVSDGDPSKRPFNRATPALYKTWEPRDVAAP
jgi:type IV pilus assembly protein PilY1